MEIVYLATRFNSILVNKNIFTWIKLDSTIIFISKFLIVKNIETNIYQ